MLPFLFATARSNLRPLRDLRCERIATDLIVGAIVAGSCHDTEGTVALLRPGTFWNHGGAFATAWITRTDW
jgi:hypothetical protein